jgi:cell wall-associated NlpC family hydrolase
LPKVPAGAPLQPGDVLFFTRNAGGGGINHVTLHAGDVNGNGTPDMIEAAWYGTPLRIVDNWPANRYFAERFTFAGRPGGN